MKHKLFILAILCALFFTSCTRYIQAGQGGCYFAKYKTHTPKNVVRIR